MMRNWGFALVAVGIIWLAIAFNLNTSVETYTGYFGTQRVENIGLIARRQNHLSIAGLITLVGALMVIFGGPRQPASPITVREPSAEKRSLPDSIERDLNEDGYRLWLADRYDIKRNELFDKFVFNNKTYDTLDAALLGAHELAVQEHEEAEAKRQQVDADQEAIDAWREENARVSAMADKVIYGVIIVMVILIALALMNGKRRRNVTLLPAPE